MAKKKQRLNIKLIILFIYLLAESGLSCGMQDLLLQSAGSLLRCADFPLVVARRLSCPEACGVLVPPPGIKLVSSALQDGFLTPGTHRKSPKASNFF